MESFRGGHLSVASHAFFDLQSALRTQSADKGLTSARKVVSRQLHLGTIPEWKPLMSGVSAAKVKVL